MRAATEPSKISGGFMNRITGRSGLAIAALLCGATLAGCNAVEDVRQEPSTPLPNQQVVLEGKVYGLGIRRSIALQNGTSSTAPSRLVQGVLGEPIGARGRETRFNFGSLDEGSSYNIIVRPDLVPFGKTCTVNNGTGTVHYSETDPHRGAPQNIEVVCINTPTVARYDIRVATPDPFRSATGAKVILMTEDGVFEADPKDTADGDPNFVWFRKALITVPAAGVIPFQNIITATTSEGSTSSMKLVNRCAVANHTFASPAGTGADVTNVAVGACTFSVGGADTASGGAVRYSRPVGVTVDPAMGAGGVTLELRYPNGKPVPSTTGPTTEVNITAFGGSFTFPTLVTSGADCPATKEGEAPIPCEVRGFYEVVVKSQPTGQRCLVASTTVGMTGPLVGLTLTSPAVSSTNNANTNFSGAANLYILDESVATGTFPTPPANYTGLRVYCRAIPTSNVLTGTYQLMNQTTVTAATSAITGSLAWSPAPSARREYSHMLTLFADGTFLFAAHTASDAVNTTAITNHTEQGFYQYVPGTSVDANNTIAGNKLRFTIHVDGNTGGLGPPVPIQLPGGLSSTEGGRTVGSAATGVAHKVLANVVIGTGTPRTIAGDFGPDGSPASATTRKVVFSEPVSLNGQLTGNWVSEDRQRFWSYNFDSTFGFSAGVNGFPNIQDTCYRMDVPTQPSGEYVPSPGGAANYCSPLGSTVQSNLSSLAHAPPPVLQTRLPGWESWMPGSELSGGSSARSPSPVKFQIATPGTFLALADPAIFPPSTLPSTSWCTTEILGVRGTMNGEVVPERKPVYFCRHRAN
jgi:hypothetical protein